MQPTMHEVNSSAVSHLGHSGSTLHVRFKNGGTYSYEGVTPEEFEALKSAKSIGQHLQSNIASRITGKKVSSAA